MSEAWLAVILLAVGTALIRASGPVALGGRDLPERIMGVVELFAPALLAALVVVETVGASEGRGIEVDARLGGIGAAGALLSVRPRAMIPAVILAAGVTALLRALG